MLRVVIDTNCLLASIPPRSAHYDLYRQFEAEASSGSSATKS